MLNRLDLRGKTDFSELPRPSMATEPPVEAVRGIIDEVRHSGDAALRDLTKRFDKVELDEIRVPQTIIDQALVDISPLLREALEQAHESILSFYRSTKA